MFRPIRLVMMIVSLSLALGFAGMRHAAPEPTTLFASAAAEGTLPASPAERLYRLLHALANLDRFPIYGDLWATEPTIRALQIGTPGFSDTEQGRNLSDLRARQVGGASHPTGSLGLMDALRHETGRYGPGGSTFGGRPPPAEPKRLREGD
jgi:hypothetical protein